MSYEIGDFVMVSAKTAYKVRKDLINKTGQVMDAHWGYRPTGYTVMIEGKEYFLMEDELEKFHNPLQNG